MEGERYVRIDDGEPVEVVRYGGDPMALRAWGGLAVTVVGAPLSAFVGSVEVAAGDRVVSDGEGNLEVRRPYEVHGRYRRQPVE